MRKEDVSSNPNQDIASVYENLFNLSKDARGDRKSLDLWEMDGPKPFTILGEIETFAADIAGYATRVVHGSIDNHQVVLAHLRNRDIFRLPHVASWYSSQEMHHPHLKKYVKAIDELRLLIIQRLEATL